MVRWLERNGYDVSYSTGRRHRPARRRAAGAPRLPVGRPRRVLVGRPARERRGGARRRRAPRLLQRQRGLLEDALGAEHRRLRHAVPHARLLQGDARQRQDRPAARRVDRAPGATRASARPDGGRPENALTGTIFTVNGIRNDALEVPAADGKMRFWRNTEHRDARRRARWPTLPTGTLGFEWDEDLDNGSRPPGLVRLSTTTVTGVPLLQDYGSTYAPGTATHHLTLYRHASGALVFGAGTVQWSWGLDDQHDLAGDADRRAHAAGDGQPLRRHGRAARHAAGRSRRRPRPRPTRPPRRRRSRRRRAARPSRSARR